MSLWMRIGAVCVRAVELPLRASFRTFDSADAIVVLGCHCEPHRPGRFARERADEAHRLWKAGVAPLIIVAGGNVQGAVEADVISNYLILHGIPESALIREGVSKNTWENAREVRGIALERSIRKIVVVTQRFHAHRALQDFQDFGFDATIACCDLRGPRELERRPMRGLLLVSREIGALLNKRARFGGKLPWSLTPRPPFF